MKQEPHVCYSKIDDYFNAKGFMKCKSEPSLYTKKRGGLGIIIVALYVANLVFTENSTKIIEEFKNDMVNKY